MQRLLTGLPVAARFTKCSRKTRCSSGPCHCGRRSPRSSRSQNALSQGLLAHSEDDDAVGLVFALGAEFQDDSVRGLGHFNGIAAEQ